MGCKEHDHNIEDIVKDYRASCGTECKLFENAVFEELFDGSIRPGGSHLTQRAMELCHFSEGAKILDVGCGYGTTVEFLQSNYHVDAVGIDLSTTILERGKARNPNLNLLYGDAEMLDFPSLSFDGIFMECVLSLADNLTETLHEAYCVLKKGGKLVVSDFYIKDGEKINTENQGGSKNCLDGAFVPEELKTALTEMGFKILSWEDKNKELRDFTAALIMHYGSLDAFFGSVLQEGEDKSFFTGIENYKKLGYFLLIAEKE
mgnify:CR=1 FL=1